MTIQNNMWRGQRVQQVTSTDQISVPNSREKSVTSEHATCTYPIPVYTETCLRSAAWGVDEDEEENFSTITGGGSGEEGKESGANRPKLLFLFQVMWLENYGYVSTLPFSRWKESLNVSLHLWLSTADQDSIFALCKSVQTFVQGD